MMNIVQYDDGSRPIYKQCIAQARSKIPSELEYMLLTQTSLKARNSDYRAVSDVLRLKLASEQPHMVWMDTDVLIKKWIDFPLKKGRPYINDRTASVIFVNGRSDLFKEIWDLYNLDEALKYPGWFQELINDHWSEFEIIPPGYFIHIGMSAAIQAGHYFNNIGHSGFTLYKDKNGELQLKIDF